MSAILMESGGSHIKSCSRAYPKKKAYNRITPKTMEDAIVENFAEGQKVSVTKTVIHGETFRPIPIDFIIRAGASVLLIIAVWLYPSIWSLGAARGFIVGLAWGVALSSFEHSVLRSIILCLWVGAMGAFLESTFDAIMILALGFSAAVITRPRMFPAAQRTIFFLNLMRHAIARLGRSVVSLLGGLVFLFLPFPRNPVDPAGGGDISGQFQSFLLMVVFMVVPVLAFDFCIGRSAGARRFGKRAWHAGRSRGAWAGAKQGIPPCLNQGATKMSLPPSRQGAERARHLSPDDPAIAALHKAIFDYYGVKPEHTAIDIRPTE